MHKKAIADVEKSIVDALEKQYADVLLPLKENLAPKKFGLKYVQKLAKRSVCQYIVPDEVSWPSQILVVTFWYAYAFVLKFWFCFSAWNSFEFHEEDARCIAPQDRNSDQVMGFLYPWWWKYSTWRAPQWSNSDAKSQV